MFFWCFFFCGAIYINTTQGQELHPWKPTCFPKRGHFKKEAGFVFQPLVFQGTFEFVFWGVLQNLLQQKIPRERISPMFNLPVISSQGLRSGFFLSCEIERAHNDPPGMMMDYGWCIFLLNEGAFFLEPQNPQHHKVDNGKLAWVESHTMWSFSEGVVFGEVWPFDSKVPELEACVLEVGLVWTDVFKIFFPRRFFTWNRRDFFWGGDGSHLKGEVCFDFLLVRRRYKIYTCI